MRIFLRTSAGAAVAALVLGVAALAGGCGQQPKATSTTTVTAAPPAPSGPGTLEVDAGDDPFAFSCFSEASIVIDEIDVQPAGMTGEDGYVSLTSTPATVDLLVLGGGATEAIAAGVIPPGRYGHIRVAVSKGVLTWADGSGFQKVFTPSSAGGQLERSIDVAVPPDGRASVLLDFDLPHTFGVNAAAVTGTASSCDALKSPGVMYFSPSVIAVNDHYQGQLHGVVSDAQTGSGFPGVVVTGVSPNGSKYATFSVDGSSGVSQGAYALYLAPGPWTITFEAEGRTPASASIVIATATAQPLDMTIP
jgi:hypothetical protein